MKINGTRLSSLRIGEKGIIESFTDEQMKLKLLEMGCLPGDTFTVDRFAPLGCPMAIHLESSTLSIRVDEADSVIVKVI
jgi:ferrous iron transport protein A